MAGKTSVPAAAHDAVLRTSATGEDHGERVSGYDFNHGLDLQALLRSMHATGFQASHLGQAVEEVNRMLDWRLSDEPIMETTSDEHIDLAFRKTVKCKIFLGCTSNIISSGVRETIRFLLEHHMVDVLVTTAGGVEEDLIKCLAPTFMGSFSMEGTQLRAKGLNRIGNLLVPNTNYCKFEDWVIPILDQLLAEQKEQGTLWTPSRMIARLGKEINHPDSICYWAQKNGIPIYCPAITDGSLGDMIYFHSFRNPGLVIDIVEGSLKHFDFVSSTSQLELKEAKCCMVRLTDIKGMNGEAVYAAPAKTGMILLGGGLPKHHICNANLMRNGADFAVFINTAQEYDGSDSGARPDEAVSWGKIRSSANSVKVHCDATIAFPLLVAQTFAPRALELVGSH